jgi:predicted chitinase
MQLTWNYNYGSAGKALGLPFLSSPGMVTSSSANAFNAALWFWMTRQPLKSAHTQIVTGEGFGATIRTVNGPLECDGLRPDAVQNRINAYVYFCEQLGIDPGPDQGC